MAEYIDRNYIVKAYIDLCKALNQKSKICPGADEPTVKNVFAIVMHAPAADVVEVRHGRWIEDERTYPGPGLKNNLCSVCGEIAGSWKEGLEPGRKWAYCPNCGARMGKEDEHGD